MSSQLNVMQVTWPIRGSFAISRGRRTTAETIEVSITDGTATGRGECTPYTRYGESLETVTRQIEEQGAAIAEGLDRETLRGRLPAGAARNAVDCALWDLEAKLSGVPVWKRAGLKEPQPVITAYTLSLDSVEAMGRSAAAAAGRPLLKLKLTGEGDLERVQAVRENAPNARLIVDANEAWTPAHLDAYLEPFAALGVEMIEQPLPAGADGALVGLRPPVPLCADESCHDTATLAALVDRYQMVNIKLDKTGGLTEALDLKAQALSLDFRVMVGCMLASSLAMAPAMMVAQGVDIVDLDGPLLLDRDRDPGLVFEESRVHPPGSSLWG